MPSRQTPLLRRGSFMQTSRAGESVSGALFASAMVASGRSGGSRTLWRHLFANFAAAHGRGCLGFHQAASDILRRMDG
jgi:hypothetical protein